MTEQLLCHVRNFSAIVSLQRAWEQNEISIEFSFTTENGLRNGSQVIQEHGNHDMSNHGIDLVLQWPLLQTWFNFNPSMDK